MALDGRQQHGGRLLATGSSSKARGRLDSTLEAVAGQPASRIRLQLDAGRRQECDGSVQRGRSALTIDKTTAALTTMGGKAQRIKYFEMTFQNAMPTSPQVGGQRRPPLAAGSIPAYGVSIAMEYWTIDPSLARRLHRQTRT